MTEKKRLRAKLKAVKEEQKRRRHLPIPEQGRWLERVVQGHYRYYAVPGNIRAAKTFRDQVQRHWFTALRRRSQRFRSGLGTEEPPGGSMAPTAPDSASLA